MTEPATLVVHTDGHSTHVPRGASGPALQAARRLVVDLDPAARVSSVRRVAHLARELLDGMGLPASRHERLEGIHLYAGLDGSWRATGLGGREGLARRSSGPPGLVVSSSAVLREGKVLVD